MVKIMIIALQLFFFLGACSPSANKRRSYPYWPAVRNSRWKVVKTVNQFWRVLYKSKKAIVFFGAEWCGPCHYAKWYWDKQIDFQDWRFIYYNLSAPEKRSEAILLHSFRPRLEKNEAKALPVCYIVVGARPGATIKDFSKKRFEGGPECSRELRKFLKKNYQ